MDFQFTQSQGKILVRCSMEQQAVANWFNQELNNHKPLAIQLLEMIAKAKQNPMQEYSLLGKEYSIFIQNDEIMVRANNLALQQDAQLEQDFYFYDEESIAFCGLEDFEHFLQSYLDFAS